MAYSAVAMPASGRAVTTPHRAASASSRRCTHRRTVRPLRATASDARSATPTILP
ncbi:hypothetical protein [Litorihabitans aurantiacus]|uniref:hypothetical protein n=1 Tax=Litorihabitans aurantiacus TaxID=1930061 RepID=UPI0024E11B06|nr:hypothetical protein [Litorihabitans aurantiacus]